METPQDLRYTTDHEWVRSEGELLRIGITDFAQEALGDVVYVLLPQVGTVVKRGATLGEIESTKSVSEIYAPVDGEVVEVNEALQGSPERVNSSPYEGGWICMVRPAAPSSIDELLDAEAYTSLVAE